MKIGFRATALITAIFLSAGLAITVSTEKSEAAAPTGVSAAQWSPGPPEYGVGDEHDVPVTMDDGVVLKANVYYPTQQATGLAADGHFPVVLTVTPYGKNTGDSDEEVRRSGMGKDVFLVERGYIHVVVDARGTGSSQGVWSFNQPRESIDGVQLVNWAAKLPQSNGSVGLMGTSYNGISQLLLAGRIGQNSPLKAIMPIVPSSDFYGDLAQGGGVNPLVIGLYAGNDPKSQARAIQDGLATASSPQDVLDLVDLVNSHIGTQGVLPASDWVTGGPEAFRTPYWKERAPENLLSQVVANKIPAMIIGGYRDAFVRSAPTIYAALQNASAGRPVYGPMSPRQRVSPNYQLVEGPWYHETITGAGTSHVDSNAIAVRWFDHWLKGAENGVTDTKTPFRSFDMTTGSWVETAAFPFSNATPTKFYLNESNSLTTTKPIMPGTDKILWSNTPVCSPSVSQYLLIGEDEAALRNAGLPTNPCNADDRPTQVAPTSVTYTTTPFTMAQTIAGPVSAHIEASVSSLESEWVVRLEDVAPDGTSYPLSRGVLMGSLRKLDESRTWRTADGTVIRPYHPLTQESADTALPGSLQSYEVEVVASHATIAAGHSIRITISSNDSPAVVPTAPQTLALVGGQYTIQRGGTAGSYVQIPLAEPGSLGAACNDVTFCSPQ